MASQSNPEIEVTLHLNSPEELQAYANASVEVRTITYRHAEKLAKLKWAAQKVLDAYNKSTECRGLGDEMAWLEEYLDS